MYRLWFYFYFFLNASHFFGSHFQHEIEILSSEIEKDSLKDIQKFRHRRKKFFSPSLFFLQWKKIEEARMTQFQNFSYFSMDKSCLLTSFAFWLKKILEVSYWAKKNIFDIKKIISSSNQPKNSDWIINLRKWTIPNFLTRKNFFDNFFFFFLKFNHLQS